MKASCGQKYCPRICSRVCHCPAGLARSKELLAMYRNKRLMSKPMASPALPLTAEYQAKIEAPSEPRTPLSILRSRVMSRANWYHYHAGCTRSQACRLSWAEWKQVTIPVRHNFGVLNQPNRKKPSQHYPTHIEPKPSVPYTSWAKQWLAPVSVSIILAIMGLVVFFGIVANQGNFAPGYEPPQTYHWGSK